MSRYRNISWEIDGVLANALVGSDHPTFIRGETETLEFEFFTDESVVETTTTFVLGGEDGSTLGGEDGGTLSSDGQTGLDRYLDLRKLIEYTGTNAIGTTLGGDPFVREYLTERAEVESRLVKIVPGDDVRLESGFWVAVESGTVNTRSPGPVLLSLDVTYLARANEYQTRDELIDDLSTPITQL